VATEYAWAHRADYAEVLFAIGDTPEALRRNLAALSGPLVLPQRETADEPAQLQAVLDWLQSNAGWLLILDNVDIRSALAEALRLVGGTAGGHVLLTSRLSNFPPHCRARPRRPLEPRSGRGIPAAADFEAAALAR